MNEQQINPESVIFNLSERIRLMAVEHAYAVAMKDGTIAEMKAEIEKLSKEITDGMNEEQGGE